MKYYYILFEGEEFWIETNDTGCAMRQIIVKDSKTEISSFHDCLSEVQVNEADLEGEVKRIAGTEFNAKWKDVLIRYSDLWEKAKAQNPTGSKVLVKVACFYPQGTVVEVGSARGIYAHEDDVRVGQLVTGIIQGYDEENMWILMDSEELNVTYRG